MMLVVFLFDDIGLIVINGVFMFYWGGVWSEGEGDNFMCYIGGLLGGMWLVLLMVDLGNGKFDGVWLV